MRNLFLVAAGIRGRGEEGIRKLVWTLMHVKGSLVYQVTDLFMFLYWEAEMLRKPSPLLRRAVPLKLWAGLIVAYSLRGAALHQTNKQTTTTTQTHLWKYSHPFCPRKGRISLC